MASLIRSPRIANQRRLLDGDASSEKAGMALPEKPADKKQVPDDSAMRWKADLHALSQARAELEEELRRSQQRAEKTEAELQGLQRDIDELRQDAVETGRETGYQAGQKEGRTAFVQQLDRLDELIVRITQAHEESLATAEEEIVEVVFASVVKILGDTLIHADGVIAAVRQSIKQLVSREQLTIHLSPEDKQLLETVAAESKEPLFGSAVEIVSDERIELGGCLLQTRTGGLDARLEVQMQQLRDCLQNVAARRQAERTT
jgi:flagellar biosynthesis/type III secretory pathway protein FliH